MAYEARQQGAVSQALPGDVQAPRLALRERRPRPAVRRSVRSLRNLRIEGHCAPYSRSASPLSHADRLGALARLALALYASRSPGVTRTFIRLVAGSAILGLPRDRGDFGMMTSFRTFPRRNVPLFAFCCDLEAHRQLPGSYPLALSMRSSEVPGGRSPMSSRKLRNFVQRSHTITPLAPYVA
jgi:hypothetical protein